jgi:hypothetical protein
LHSVGTRRCDGVTARLGHFTFNAPVGWPMGLAPTWTRFTASLLDDFGLGHQNQSSLKDLHPHLPVISRLLCYCAKGGNWLLGAEALTGRPGHCPSGMKQISTISTRQSSARVPMVWVTGIAPAASSSRATRSPTELHPDGHCMDTVYVVGVAPTFSRSRTERPGCWATRSRQSAPPRGFEPQPATFAESCPSMERWQR